MIWNIVPFRQVHDDLVHTGTASDFDAIVALLKPLKEDLLQLLASPSKSEVSRDRLSKKVLSIDGEEIEVNDAFINDAARIADELNLDEMVAAEIAFYAICDAQRLGVSIFEAGLTMFYVRRQYIIDIVRFCLEILPVESFDVVLGETESRLRRILEAIKAVEMGMEDLSDKSKTQEFMGFSKTADFTQTLKIQKEFLIREHESLGHIFYAYISACAPNENSLQSLTTLVRHLEKLEVLDSRILSYIPALVVWLSAPHPESFNLQLWQLCKPSSAASWKLPILQSGVALVAFISLAEEDATLPDSIQYDSIVDNVKEVIDAGALELWLAISQDVKGAQGEEHFERFKPLTRSRIPPIQFWQFTPAAATSENLQRAFETVFTGMITNLADTLREMRLSEEDMYLALNETDGIAEGASPGLDFERFMLFVATVCWNQTEAAKLFLHDADGPLFGFLRWAADCQVAFMSAAFVELIASLANDKGSSKTVHEFLNKKEIQVPSAEEHFVLSWSYIYDVIEYFVRGMTTSSISAVNTPENTAALTAASIAMPGAISFASHQNNSALYTHPTITPAHHANTVQTSTATLAGSLADSADWGISNSQSLTANSLSTASKSSSFSDDTLFILSAYMTLLARVCSRCPEARKLVTGKAEDENENFGPTHDIVPLLFKLFKAQQLISGPILYALTPLASSDLWPMLDNYVLGKFDEILLSRNDALAFLGLFQRLVNCENISSRLGEYITFVFKDILPWTVKPSEPSDSPDNTRVLLQIKVLELLKSLLGKEDHTELLSRMCFTTCVHESIFKIVMVGLDHIAELEPSHPLVRLVELSVDVIQTLLQQSSGPSASFDKPILYHLQIVPHLALYAGSLHSRLSLSSVKTLALLEQSPEFRPTIDRQSRILSILSSTTESTRIRVGLMMRVADPATDIEVKIALLEMLVSQLQDSGSPRRFMTVAHFLLGFNQSELGLDLKLGLENGVGGVLSGSSLLSAICYIVLKSLISSRHGNLKLLELCSELLWLLVKDPLTSEMVLDFLRISDFWLNTIKNEFLRIQTPKHHQTSPQQKAAMLEIWICEIQLCQKKLLLTVESHYLDALLPLVFAMVDFHNSPSPDPLSYNFLKAWCKLIPILIASGDKQTGPAFVLQTIQILLQCLPVYSRQEPKLAVPIAQLLVFLFDTYQQRGNDDSVARHMLLLLTAAVRSLQPAQVNGELRTSLYFILFQTLRLGLRAGTRETQIDMFDILKAGGPKDLQIACDDVLNYSHNQLRLGALLFVQTAVILGGRLGSVFVSEVLLQYNFVSIFIQQVAIPALISCKVSSNGSAQITDSNGFQTNILTRSGAPFHGLLDAKRRFEDTASQPKLEEAMLAEGFSSMQLAKISMSILLTVAQTRTGATNLMNSNLLSQLDLVLSDLPEELLANVLQILIAIIFSVGSENIVALDGIRNLLKKHKAVMRAALQRDAAANHALQDQSAEAEVFNVAQNLAVLFTLAGAEH